MSEEEIIGKKIKEIYETDPIVGDDVLGLGKPYYFSIVIQLENTSRFELGIHNVRPWTSDKMLKPSQGTMWAKDNGLEYRNKRIIRVIHRDPNEYFEGSLTLVLENGVLIEHQCCNGDQLYIDRLKEEC